MKKIVLLLIMIYMCGIDCYAQRTCPKCHGARRVKIPGMSGLGISTKQKKCNVCGQWYNPTDDHWHTCPSCKGAGSISSAGGSHVSKRVRDDVYQYLTPSEAAALQNLLQVRMKGTKFVNQTCYQCNGTGICQGCKGTGMIYGSQPCPGCLMTRSCGKCMGRKTIMQEVRMSNEELAELDRKIKIFMDTAQKRMK